MPRKSRSESHFVVTYRDPVEEKVTTLRAQTISDSSLGLSFIRISDFLWNTGALVVSPSEEALQKRLEHTRSLHLSIYTVLCIEEIGKNADLNFESERNRLVVLKPDLEKKP